MFAPARQIEARAPAGKVRHTGAAEREQISSAFNPLWQSLALHSAVIQPKLQISQAGDPSEREADQIADSVMRMVSPQSACSCSASHQLSGRVQRKCASCEEEEQEPVQRKEQSDTASGPSIVDQALSSPSRPLDAITRTFMEPRFGYDFSQVRVHDDSGSATSAKAIQAQAYTIGPHIVFGAGMYQPGSNDGRRLLAHELAHVTQQNSTAKLQTQPDIGNVDDAAEHEAETLASAVMSSPHQAVNLAVTTTSDRQVIRRFVPARPPTPAEEEAARQLAKKIVERAAGSSAQRGGWRQFWRVIVRRFALRGATAAGLAAADGPLPVGDLIALGLTIWMIYDIINLWTQLWREAEQIPVTEPQPQPAPESPPPAPQEQRRRPRDNCFERNPGAMPCDEPPHDDEKRDEIVAEFLIDQGRDFEDLGDCFQVGGRIPEGVIDDCNHASAVRFHCRVNGTTDEVSIFACDCCDAEGNLRHQWSVPHWSVNMSRRGGR